MVYQENFKPGFQTTKDQSRISIMNIEFFCNPLLSLLCQNVKEENAQKTKAVFISLYTAYRIWRLFDASLANLLALQTLRHGTSLPNFLKILHHGSRPELGARSSLWYTKLLNAPEIAHNCRRHFFMFKDSEARLTNYFFMNDQINKKIKGPMRCLCNQIAIRSYPRLHAMTANISYFKGSEKEGLIKKVFDISLGTSLGLVGPILKMHTSLEGVKERGFVDDPDYFGAAYKSRQVFLPSDFFVLGSLKEAYKRGLLAWGKRVLYSPLKPALGLMQTAAFLVISKCALNVLQENKDQSLARDVLEYRFTSSFPKNVYILSLELIEFSAY